MKNILKTSTLLFTIYSCSPIKTVTERRCESILENDYKNILEDKFKSIVGNDTLFLNEVKFECVHTSMYIQKGMYDKFGKWDQVIYPSGQRYPILFWKNVKLFPDDTTEFTVAADGLENSATIYTSVLVFDKNNRDLLTENSEYKSKLIQYFSNIIKTDNPQKKGFYEIFWKTVNPERWEALKKHSR